MDPCRYHCLLSKESVPQENNFGKILEYNFMYNGTLASSETGMTSDSLNFVTVCKQTTGTLT